MPKVIVVQVVYNNRPWIEAVFFAVFKQTFRDFKFVAVIAGNEDGSKELIQSNFPEVEIIDPGYNIGFAAGHNLVFEKHKDAEFFQLVNPDLILEPNYIEEMLKAFEDPKVGAATGKLLKIPEFGIMNYGLWKSHEGTSARILDTTGVNIFKSGRARDRGQHEEDVHQYDNLPQVQAVSAAGAMYRPSALDSVKVQKIRKSENQKSDLSDSPISPTFEFFDEDFHSYWEDVDLSWRMSNARWKCVFQPSAIGFHGRTAGSSEKGYADILGFISHHKKLSMRGRQLNYKNHVFMYIKNSPWFYPQFFIREFFMLIYVLTFEISTLKVLPEMFKQLPKIWKKRKLIYR